MTGTTVINEILTELYKAGLSAADIVHSRSNRGLTAVTVACYPRNENHSYEANLYCSADNQLKLVTIAVVNGKVTATSTYHPKGLYRACMLLVNNRDSWQGEITNLIIEDMKL